MLSTLTDMHVQYSGCTFIIAISLQKLQLTFTTISSGGLEADNLEQVFSEYRQETNSCLLHVANSLGIKGCLTISI